ncbi:MAG: molybdenum cofactor guanylyltransferase [Sideroxydans sp.]|jgi:molybdopterin-guanine dinucleotide biosynthesis protein A
MIPDCTAVILTGGDSRRMGQDKASLKLGERSLMQHVITLVQPLFSDVVISVRHPRSDITLPQVCDDSAHRGPLAGLAAGLQSAKTPWIFAVACDMPFIEPIVIERLAKFRDDHQAVVPMVQGYPQPLLAFYSADCLAEVLGCLNGDGKHSMRELLERLQVRYVSEDELLVDGPVLSSFIDLDTPEDVAMEMNKQGMY